METDAWYWYILEELDAMDRSTTEWEYDFLENVLSHRDRRLTNKQKTAIESMKEKYLA